MMEMTSRYDFAISLAKEAGQLLVQILNSSSFSTSLKNDHSVVTEADIASDKLILSSIQNHFPNDSIMSEELHPTGAPIPDTLDNYLWIIDPLDGTTNFSLRLPHWGVSIACLYKGEPLIGCVYFPVIDELYSAQNGGGSYLNNNLLQTNSEFSRQNLSFFSCCSRTHQSFNISVPYKARILGSACYTLCSVAKGTAILGFEATPKIWDIAAGWLIIQEAGGLIESLDGKQPFPIVNHIDYSKTNFPVIAGKDQKIISRAHQQIIPKTSRNPSK